jgi:hypothetical protein
MTKASACRTKAAGVEFAKPEPTADTVAASRQVNRPHYRTPVAGATQRHLSYFGLLTLRSVDRAAIDFC